MLKQRLIEIVKQLTPAVMIFIFCYTGVTKLIEWRVTAAFLKTSPFHAVTAETALIVPTLELIIVAMLLIPSLRLIGLYAAFVMMCAFTIYIVYMLLFYPHLPCSCGGVISSLSWPAHLVFNLSICSLILITLLLHRHQRFIAINRSSRTPGKNSRHHYS